MALGPSPKTARGARADRFSMRAQFTELGAAVTTTSSRPEWRRQPRPMMRMRCRLFGLARISRIRYARPHTI